MEIIRVESESDVVSIALDCFVVVKHDDEIPINVGHIVVSTGHICHDGFLKVYEG